MTETQTISTLLAASVLTETGTDDELTFSSSFLDSVDERTRQVRDGDWLDGGLTGATEYRETFLTLAERSPDLLGTYWALDDALPDVSFTELLQVVLVVDQLMHPPERTAGTPNRFFPVRGDRAPGLVTLIRHGIVYVWREDCDPCDLMAAQFDELDDRLTDDAVLLSVYGPDWARELNDAFAVAGAPTTLFLKNGRVDSRLVGAYESHLVAAELETTAKTME